MTRRKTSQGEEDSHFVAMLDGLKKGDLREGAQRLVAFAPYLTAKRVAETISAIKNNPDAISRAEVLTSIAASPRLEAAHREVLTNEALLEIELITLDERRAEALARIAPVLKREQFDEALAATQAIEDGWYRSAALVGLAAHIDDVDLQLAVLSTAKSFAYASHQEWLSDYDVLSPGIIPKLNSKQFSHALVSAKATHRGNAKVNALISLVSSLQDNTQRTLVINEALEAALSIEIPELRSSNLVSVALYARNEEQKTLAIKQAVLAAISIDPEDEEWTRALSFARFAHYISVNQLLGIIKYSKALEDNWRCPPDSEATDMKIIAEALEDTHNNRFEMIGGSEYNDDDLSNISTYNISDTTAKKDEGLVKEPPTKIIDSRLMRYFTERDLPRESWAALAQQLDIEIARATRSKWLGRIERGGELATLSAPLFLKRVHAADIAPDGTVVKETIRAIDPDLMTAVEAYISQRKKRGVGLGDAEGLNFVASRPATNTAAKPRVNKLG